MMQRITEAVDGILKGCVIVLMGLSALNVLWQVFSRYVLNQPSSWTEELARYMLIWVSFLGAAYAVRLRMHLSIDLLVQRLTERNRLYLQMMIQACVLLFALWVMVLGGIRLVNLTLMMNQTSAALQIKLAYVYSVLPISGLLILFYCVVHIIEIKNSLRLGKESILVDHK